MVQKAQGSLGELTPNNVGQLKTLNAVLFPVYYNDKFYKNSLESGELTKLGMPSAPLSPFSLDIFMQTIRGFLLSQRFGLNLIELN